MSFAPIVLAAIAAMVLREPARSRDALAVKRQRDRISKGQHVATAFAIDEQKALHNEWRQIFAADLRRQTAITSIFGFLVNFSIGFVIVLGVTYVILFDHVGIGGASLALLVEGAATIAGEVVVGLLADRIASRNIIIIWNIIGGLSLALLAIHGGVGWVFLVMGLFGFFGQGYQGTWWRYLADSFPTRARGTGSTFVTGIYFFGLTFAPTVFGLVMNGGNFVAAPLVASAIVIVGALILLAGRNIPPKQDLEEIAS